MPGAGTDKTKRWIEQPAPIVVLVEPQLGENIGAAARAMANFGLGRLRLVKPVQGWPNEQARAMAAGADRVLDDAQVYATLAGGDRRLHLRAGDDGAQSRSGQAGGRRRGGGGASGPARGGGRDRRHRVRPRAQRAGKPRGGARRRHRHAAGQSGLRLAQSGAGGGDRRLRVVQAAGGRQIAVRDAAALAAGGEAAARRVLCRPGARTGEGRILPPGGKARHHERQPAQYLSAHAADAAGHPHAARRHHRRSRRGAKARRAAACSIPPAPRSCAR